MIAVGEVSTTADHRLGPFCRGRIVAPSSTGASTRRVFITTTVSPLQLDEYAQAQLDDLATPEQLKVLESDKEAWAAALWRLLDDADAALAKARRSVRGPERANVLNDLDEECFRIDDALTALIGPRKKKNSPPLRTRSASNSHRRRRPAQRSCSCRGTMASWLLG